MAEEEPQVLSPSEEMKDWVQEKKQQIWIYGINDHLDVNQEELSQKETTGVLRRDFTNICKEFCVVPHNSLRVLPKKDSNATSPPAPTEGDNEEEPVEEVDPYSTEETFHFVNVLMDTVSWRIFSHLLQTSHHVKNMRIDIEMMNEFRAALTDKCTLRQLQLDYNPLETSLKCAPWSIDTARMHELSAEEVSTLDLERMKHMEYRSLRNFARIIEERWGSVQKGFKEMDVDSSDALNLDEFLHILKGKEVRGDFAFEAFHVMDGPNYGNGDGLVVIQEFKDALDGIPEISEEEEENDAIGTCWGSLMDETSPLERLSLRACELGRVDLRPMATFFKANKYLQCLNLWGNKVDDVAINYLMPCFEEQHSLTYLGLGNNQITSRGLKIIAEWVGGFEIDAEQVVEVKTKIAEQEKTKAAEETARAKAGPVADASGAERELPPLHVDTLKENEDGSGVWYRNTQLSFVDLSGNDVSDVEVVKQIQPLGVAGHVICLVNNPCASDVPDFSKLEGFDEENPGWTFKT